MKNPYSKPMLTIQNFGMVQEGAKDCADEFRGAVNATDIHYCGWEYIPDLFLFLIGNGTCTEDGTIYDFACYNNPGEGQYLFRS